MSITSARPAALWNSSDGLLLLQSPLPPLEQRRLLPSPLLTPSFLRVNDRDHKQAREDDLRAVLFLWEGEGEREDFILQHQVAAQEGVPKLAHKVSQMACLYNQERGAAGVSTPITADTSKG